jgi:hypothetical protein
MNLFELIWFVFHAGLLLFGAGWLCQTLPWYLAIPASVAGVAALVGVEVMLAKIGRR